MQTVTQIRKQNPYYPIGQQLNPSRTNLYACKLINQGATNKKIMYDLAHARDAI